MPCRIRERNVMNTAENYNTDELPDDEEELCDDSWRQIRNWSLPGGSVFGVIIRIHFLIILGIVLCFSGTRNYWDLLARGILFFMVTLAFLLHEMAHAFSARYFNNTVEGICLFPPFGGMAFIKSRSNHPLHRIIIFISGPLTNLFLAGVTFLLLTYHGGVLYHIYMRFFVRDFFIINLVIGIFNLLPLFPLDGGRILKDFLLLCKANKRVTNITTIFVSLLSFITIGSFLFMKSDYVDIIILAIIWVVGTVTLAIDGNDVISLKVP